MHYNRRFVGYFMGTYQAIMGGGSRWRSLPLPEAAGQRRHKTPCAHAARCLPRAYRAWLVEALLSSLSTSAQAAVPLCPEACTLVLSPFYT